MNRTVTSTLWTLVLAGLALTGIVRVPAAEPRIPYPGALDAAAVSVDRLDSILEHALLAGNGDINALVYSDGGPLNLMLTKNDVRDAPPINYNIAVPVFPGDVVGWWSPETERNLFARTIDQLQWNGNNSAIMLAVARARLSLPGTVDWTREELQTRLRPNGTLTLNRLGAHFNQFGHYTEQFGASLAVSELLIQSVHDPLRASS